MPCDVLVPAAIGGVITDVTAGSLECKYVVEAANGPTTPEGDAVLREKGVIVLPDIYTNGGMSSRSDLIVVRLSSTGCLELLEYSLSCPFSSISRSQRNLSLSLCPLLGRVGVHACRNFARRVVPSYARNPSRIVSAQSIVGDVYY